MLSVNWYWSRFSKFYNIRARWPVLSCDKDQLNKFSFLQSLKALYEIWLQLAPWLLSSFEEMFETIEI